MSRRSQTDPFAKLWAGIVIAVAAGAIIWDTVPHWAIYAVGGIAVVAVIVWLLSKLRGRAGFDLGSLRSVASRPGRSSANAASSTPASLPRLSSADQARLRMAVGDRCENPWCKQPDHRGLQVHHIVSRRNPRSTNKLENLLVLCPNCHHEANHALPGTSVQQQWAKEHGRFADLRRVKNWDATH